MDVPHDGSSDTTGTGGVPGGGGASGTAGTTGTGGRTGTGGTTATAVQPAVGVRLVQAVTAAGAMPVLVERPPGSGGTTGTGGTGGTTTGTGGTTTGAGGATGSGVRPAWRHDDQYWCANGSGGIPVLATQPALVHVLAQSPTREPAVDLDGASTAARTNQTWLRSGTDFPQYGASIPVPANARFCLWALWGLGNFNHPAPAFWNGRTSSTRVPQSVST